METTLTSKETKRALRLSPLRLAMIGGLVGNVAMNVILQAFVVQALIVPLAIIMILTLVVAGVCATRWRWAPLLAALWVIISVIPGLEPYISALTQPAETGLFIVTLVSLLLLLIALVAGVAELVAGRSQEAGSVPRWLSSFLFGTATFAVGASLVATLSQPGATAGISAEVLAQLPALVGGRNTFDQAELRARVGERVVLRLENSDTLMHSFDIDEFNVHVPMPTGSPALAIFTPTEAGSYRFYCRIPGHTEAGMFGTLIVEP